MRLITTAAIVAATIAALASNAYAAGAHVHGRATLNIAPDGKTLTLQFTSPMDDLVGFEHAPRTDKQKAALRELSDTFNNKPQTLFVPTPEAQCSKASVQLDSPLLDGKARGSHSALDAELVFTCQRPELLKGLRVTAFDAFPRLKRIDAQVAGRGKQKATRLTSGSREISW